MSHPAKNTSVDAFRGIASFLVVWSHLACLMKAAHYPSASECYSICGDWIIYFCQGSSYYFFLISGFVIASKLPEWRRDKRGLIVRGTQRMTRILIVFWCGLVLVLLCNSAKYLLDRHPWTQLNPYNIACEFLLVVNLIDTKYRLIPPDWYLEVDIQLLFGVLFSYALYAKLQQRWKSKVRTLLWLSTIPLTAYSLSEESRLYSSFHELHGLQKSLSYFMMGILACHARYHRTALLCLIINSGMYLVFNDHTNLMNYHLLRTSAGVLLAWLLFCSQQAKSVTELFNKPVFSLMNKLSFAVFIFHFFFLSLMVSVARHLAPHSLIGFTCIMLLVFPLTYGFAWVFHHHVEKRLLKFHDAMWSGTLWQNIDYRSHSPATLSKANARVTASVR